MGNELSSQISVTVSEIPVGKLKEPGKVKINCNAYVPRVASFFSGRETVIIPDV